MIQYLKNNEIDIKKYDTCIELSTNSRIYAFSWYLNIVADNWDVLVLNDYEAVMPLPWRRKYFIKYIYPPAWTQQLGVFSSTHISEKLVLDFIKAIPKKFKKITIQFNSENKFKHKNLTERVNYVLPLNKSYEEIYKNFNQNRKRDLKKANKYKLTCKNCNIDNLIAIAKINYLHLNYTKEDYQKLKLTTNLLLKNKKGLLLGVFNIEKTLIGGTFFLKDELRITYLFSVMNTEGIEKKVATFLINSIIEEFSDSKYMLDFEGSMVVGISNYFKSYGAKNEHYTRLERYGI